MKHTIALIIISILFAGTAMAQKRPMGPAAKNYKPWKDTTRSSVQLNIAVSNNHYASGANIKNTLRTENAETIAVTPHTGIIRPKGANAKNRRPIRIKKEIRRKQDEQKIENAEIIL